MKVNMMTNLWVGYNRFEDFRVLICAIDSIAASEIAESYRIDTHLEGTFEISDFKGNERFDCDYVLTYGDDL